MIVPKNVPELKVTVSFALKYHSLNKCADLKRVFDVEGCKDREITKLIISCKVIVLLVHYLEKEYIIYSTLFRNSIRLTMEFLFATFFFGFSMKDVSGGRV